MLHQIEEPCSLGAHAAVIVPPTWIIKVKKPQVTAGTLVLLGQLREKGTAASCFSPLTFNYAGEVGDWVREGRYVREKGTRHKHAGMVMIETRLVG